MLKKHNTYNNAELSGKGRSVPFFCCPEINNIIQSRYFCGGLSCRKNSGFLLLSFRSDGKNKKGVV